MVVLIRLAFPMIASLFIGCTLFARNSLAGQPVLQQRLMKLPIYVGLFSDVSPVLSPTTPECRACRPCLTELTS